MAARPEQLEGVRIRLMIICGRDVCMNHTSGDVVGRDNVGEDAVKKIGDKRHGNGMIVLSGTKAGDTALSRKAFGKPRQRDSVRNKH